MAWIERLAGVAGVVGLGVLLGLQYVDPNKRVLSVIAAAIVVGLAWRVDMVSGLGVMIFALPFPRGTVFGSTNFALILLLLVIYLLRITLRQAQAPTRTPVDGPIAALMLAFVISFYSIERADHLNFAFQNFQIILATQLMFYVIVQNTRSEADLRRLHGFHAVSILSVYLVGMWELNHPGGTLIPGWIAFTGTHGDEFDAKNVRIGSTFYDYELLADFCGLNLLFFAFLLMKARNAFERAFHAGMLGFTLIVMFMTVTRGPFVSLSVALAFMLVHMRRHLKIVPLTIGSAAVVAAGAFANFFVSNFTRSGNVLQRIEETQLVGGWMPDSRAGAWQDAWTRMLMHPVIGWGPYYSAERGLKFWYWPHCLYLYVGNLVGFVGLSFFFWLLATLWKVTRPQSETPTTGDYTKDYLFFARFQLIFFLVDQIKIEYLRNPVYQFQIWVVFAFWVSASMIVHRPAPLARAAA